MCGFAGIFRFDDLTIPVEKLNTMSRLLEHRGPDGSGIYHHNNMGLIHRRLSIIDKNPRSNQPMHSFDNRYVIAYNGECYNYKEIHADLVKKGYPFKTTSDTEVILNGFIEYGTQIVEKMNGMFAFMIFDKSTQMVYLFRDRLGIKPLYYSHNNQRIVFSSEIKPILSYDVEAELNYKFLPTLLNLRYLPNPDIAFKNIYKIKPASVMIVKNTGEMVTSTYWNIPINTKCEYATYEESKERLFDILSDSVLKRTMGEASVSCLLSGGIDSTLITALASKNVHRLCGHFLDVPGNLSEKKETQDNAKYLNVDLDIINLEENLIDSIPMIINQLEEPILDSTILLSSCLFSKIKERIVLSGEGADEIFSGYIHHQAYGLMAKLNQNFQFIGSHQFKQLLKLLPASFWNRLSPYSSRLGKEGVNRFISLLDLTKNPFIFYQDVTGLFNHDLEQMFSPLFLSHHDFSPDYASMENLIKLRQIDSDQIIPLLDLGFWTPDYSLLRLDKIPMFYSIECRVPFFDHRLVEFAINLPSEFKTSYWHSKKILRDSVRNKGIIPGVTLKRKKKPFHLPMGEIFKNNFYTYAKDILHSASFKKRGIFDEKFINNILSPTSHAFVSDKKMTALAFFEQWCQLYLDGNWHKSS